MSGGDYQPGDLDRLLFAVSEACIIDTRGVVKRSGVPWVRAKAALAELEKRGKVTSDSGHRHGDDGPCHCASGIAAGLPKLTHWHLVERRA
jgi:hypothetical protein